MIVAFGHGRAGNLMFQLGGIDSARRHARERLALVNFHKLAQIFPTLGKHGILLAVPENRASIALVLEKVLQVASSLRIIGSIEETYVDSTVLVRKRGIFPIAHFRGGWCQSENTVSTVLLRRLYRESVKESGNLLQSTLSHVSGRVCFVHIRRGDYLNFPSSDYPAALPACWYRSQISRIAEKWPNTTFLFLSDDLEHVRQEFRDIENAEFVDAGNRESFQLMTEADDGILSPSSYSWWGAYFAQLRSEGTFIAPYFWTGWRLELWHPYPQVKSSFLSYELVECFDS